LESQRHDQPMRASEPVSTIPNELRLADRKEEGTSAVGARRQV
jgi:hypothetical protein